MQQPCEGELRDCGVMGLRDGIEFAAWLRKLARRYWKPRDECQLVFCAVLLYIFVLSVANVVLVLYADDYPRSFLA